MMKETALQKTDQDEVGRFVIMKMSGESGHLLRSSSFTVYKTLQRKEQWREYASALLHNMIWEWVHTSHSYYYRTSNNQRLLKKVRARTMHCAFELIKM